MSILPLSNLSRLDSDRLLHQLPSPVLVFDLRNRVTLANRAACDLLDSTADQLHGCSIEALVASPFNVGTNSATLMRGGTFENRAMVWKSPRGTLVEVLASASLIRDELGCPVATAYCFRRLPGRAEADPIRYQACHDHLGLPNRVPLTERLQSLIVSEATTGRVPGLLYVDVDHFSRINGTLGHEAGDRLLTDIGRRLARQLRVEDLVARYSGDIFGIVVDLAQTSDAVPVASKLLDAFRRPFECAGVELGLTASIGIATFPVDGETVSDLVRSALGAATQAKRLGGDRWLTADDQVQRSQRRRFEIESRLRKALQDGRLALEYQPIVDTTSRTPLGFEALLRWPDAQDLTIQEVTEVAEESGLICAVGQWVLERAVAESRAFLERYPSAHVSVNVSTLQLDGEPFVDWLARLLEVAGVPPKRLQLEITETAVIDDPGHLAETLDGLRALGTSLAVDDFGSGHASLGYIRNLPVDCLKIDRTLIDGIGTRIGEAMVRAILSLAAALGLSVVGEGVETEEQMAFLRARGCTAAQGFLISKALSPDALDRWLDGSPTAS